MRRTRPQAQSMKASAALAAAVAVILTLSPLVSASGAIPVVSQCSFTQTSSDPHPVPANFTPAPYNGTDTFVCPEYTNSSCCNQYQNGKLSFNFFLINAFGGAFGNGACVANLQRLWCAFTCAPDQARIIDVNGVVPTSSGDALSTTLYVDREWACGLWASCKGVALASTFSTLEQFLTYQSATGVSIGHSVTAFEYVEPGAPRGMTAPIFDCCSYPASLDTPGAPGNTSSPCTYCAGTCGTEPCYTGMAPGGAAGGGSSGGNDNGGAIDAPLEGALYGFEWLPLAILYGMLALFSALVMGYRYARQRMATPKAEPQRATQVSMPPWESQNYEAALAAAAPGAGTGAIGAIAPPLA